MVADISEHVEVIEIESLFKSLQTPLEEEEDEEEEEEEEDGEDANDRTLSPVAGWGIGVMSMSLSTVSASLIDMLS